jgi:hypothetical protein
MSANPLRRVLVSAGNTNLNTFRGVCYAARQTLGDFLAIHIFDTPASDQAAQQAGRSQSIREFFAAADIRQSLIDEADMQIKIPDRITDLVREFGRDQVYVDLTNGQKLTASVLYAVATIARISNVYVLTSSVRLTPESDITRLNTPQDWQYTRVEPVQGVTNISQSSYVELIYYRDRIEEVSTPLLEADQPFGATTRNALMQSLVAYFSAPAGEANRGKALESCIMGLGRLCEDVTRIWFSVCREKGLIPSQAARFGKQVELIARVWEAYRLRLKDDREDRRSLDSPAASLFYAAPCADQMVAVMRVYRNIAAHPGPCQLKKEDARLCLDLTLQLLDTLSRGGLFTPADE